MRSKFIYTLIIIIIFHPFNAKSNSSNPIGFIENVGQWEGDFLYKYSAGTSTFFINKNGHVISSVETKLIDKLRHPFEITKINNEKNINIKYHSFMRYFLNANKFTTWINEEPLDIKNKATINYISRNKINSTIIYESIIQKNIYDGINLKYYFENDKVKYDLIIAPKVNPKQIKFKYEGTDKIEIKNESLFITTSLGEFREEKPYAYQIINNKLIEVSCSYNIIQNQIISFKIGDYNHDYELIIDPILFFGTFSGSTSDNWGMCATPGNDGSLFVAGISFGQTYPVTMGAYQSIFSGGDVDISISKYSSNGKQLLYSTYLGGISTDVPVSIISDKNGDLLIMGRTKSGSSFPHLNRFGILGQYDIFITRLSSDGKSLKGGILIGGSWEDGANLDYNITSQASPVSSGLLNYSYGDNNQGDIIIDNNEDVIVVSQSNSTDFPLKNSFQTSKSIGQDCVILKFSANLDSLKFSSFYGGDNSDAVFSVAINKKNEIIIGGNTLSNQLPGDTTNTLNSKKIGNIDGFITIISEKGSPIKTSFIGTNSLDIIYRIHVDQNDFIYFSAITLGKWPIINANFFDLDAKQAIAKIDPSLSRFIYSTTFGRASSLPNIIPGTLFVDKTENVYVVGWGGSIICPSTNSNVTQTSGTSGMRVTSKSLQSTTDGNDFYFFVLEKDSKSQLYGSYFGQSGGIGDHLDGGKLRFDSSGTLYLAICSCAGTSLCSINKPLPITNGAVFPSRSFNNCNSYAAKIKLSENDIVTNTINIYSNNEISFFPNPAKNAVSIKGVSNQLNKNIIYVFDITGKLLIKEPITFNKKINIEKLTNGIYFFRITDENGILIKDSKIIKQ
jgi:hypothetical protein